MIRELTTSKSFEKATRRGTPVLIDFFTTWCGPCVEMAETLKDGEHMLKEKFPDLEIYKVDCDKLNDVADRYDISSIPTLMLFNGDFYKMYSGTKTIEEICEFIEAHKKPDYVL